MTTATEQASHPVNVAVSAQVVRVSGPRNAEAVNEALRAPVDARLRAVRDDIAAVRARLRDDDERWDDPASITITANALVQGTDFVSVRYDNQPDTSLITNSSWQSFDSVTVDVRTGEALTPDEIYRPGAAGELADRWLDEEAIAGCPDISTGSARVDLTEENLGREVTVAFARDHASFTVELPRLGRANACGIPTVDLPYDELSEVLDPVLVADLTTG
ncbi:hypothetical protein [Actinophytocola glycyrrhizae]|uniref:Uncharacterized protein n=1 Tax=Actinophytocola glycyrrhizae TaxID=2044873 RepID=A0ABV9RV96_9PSEU